MVFFCFYNIKYGWFRMCFKCTSTRWSSVCFKRRKLWQSPAWMVQHFLIPLSVMKNIMTSICVCVCVLRAFGWTTLSKKMLTSFLQSQKLLPVNSPFCCSAFCCSLFPFSFCLTSWFTCRFSVTIFKQSHYPKSNVTTCTVPKQSCSQKSYQYSDLQKSIGGRKKTKIVVTTMSIDVFKIHHSIMAGVCLNGTCWWSFTCFKGELPWRSFTCFEYDK